MTEGTPSGGKALWFKENLLFIKKGQVKGGVPWMETLWPAVCGPCFCSDPMVRRTKFVLWFGGS
jgi:hypothetical protein